MYRDGGIFLCSEVETLDSLNNTLSLCRKMQKVVTVLALAFLGEGSTDPIVVSALVILVPPRMAPGVGVGGWGGVVR